MTIKGKRPKLSWKQKIVRDMERVENLLPEPDFMQDDWPDWVRQMAAEIWKGAVPGATVRQLDDPTARELGRIVGVKRASLSELERKEIPEKIEQASERMMQRLWGEKAEERFAEQCAFMETKFWPAYVRAIKKALTMAAEQPGREQADFFKGYAEMVWEDPDNRANSSTPIYTFMILFWRGIEKLESVTELHNLLCRVFDSHLVGDRKRIEKMCERKGLHFRGRGRPAFRKKSDTVPA